MAGPEAETPLLSDNTSGNIVSVTICGVPMSLDENPNDTKNVSKDKASSKNNNDNNKEKCNSLTAKKPPKPPRPAKGLSLDAADRKLIKEISELARMKRARVGRTKKMKAAKEHSSFAVPFGVNLIAVVFTIIFCIVVIYQGCHSSGISSGNISPLPAIPVEGSHKPTGTLGNTIVLKDQRNFSSSGVPLSSVESPE
ncbi:Unknown protein [Striga hermonthica]|uniref:Transmembrane protein n=1 Tax=Striga hermonthica TaxID=68872 RepID=A0A9N7N9E3_STRHE|nr:Unknown protein [Striga hermonthica]